MEDFSKTKKDTRQRIVDAFLDLYAEKPFEQITIKSITEYLAINRGTFYLHYSDLNDLLTSIEDERLHVICSINERHRRYHLSSSVQELKEFFTPTLEYIYENKAIIRVLIGPHSRPRFIETFKDIMRSNIIYKSESPTARYKWDSYKKYLIDILVEGNVGIIRNWICSDNNQSVQDVANSFGDILMNLPYTNLRE